MLLWRPPNRVLQDQTILRTLIIVIDLRDDKIEAGIVSTPFAHLEIRLVHTGNTDGLSQPITLDEAAGLNITRRINENEVEVTLAQAIRFVIDMDRREDAFLEKSDEKVLDHWLGLPQEQLKLSFSEFSTRCLGIWTGAKEDIPVGPSTKWWKRKSECKDILAVRPGWTEKAIKRRIKRARVELGDERKWLAAQNNRQ
jgi:hypothetical protein